MPVIRLLPAAGTIGARGRRLPRHRMLARSRPFAARLEAASADCRPSRRGNQSGLSLLRRRLTALIPAAVVARFSAWARTPTPQARPLSDPLFASPGSASPIIADRQAFSTSEEGQDQKEQSNSEASSRIKEERVVYHHVKELMYTVRVDTPHPQFGNMLFEHSAAPTANLSLRCSIRFKGSIATIRPEKNVDRHRHGGVEPSGDCRHAGADAS